MKSLKQLVSLLWPCRWWVILAVLLNWGTISSSIGLLMTSAYVISRAALQPSIADLQVAIVGIRLFGILRGLLRYLERLVSHSVHFKLLSELRLRFYQAIEPRFPSGMCGYSSGELHQQVISDMETLKFFFIRWAAPVVSALFVLITISLLLRPYDPRLPLFTALFFITAGWGVPLVTSLLVRKSTARLTQMRSELHLGYVESLQGLSDLQTNGAWNRRLALMVQKDELYLKTQRRIKSIAALQEQLIHLLMMGNVALALWLTIPLVTSGTMPGFFLAVIALGIMAGFEAVQALPAAAAFKEQSRAAWERIHQTMNPENPVKSAVKPFPPAPVDSLAFEQVCFAYEDRAVLEELSFEIRKGRRVLIMGRSGAGKSTLISLLMQFYQPLEGAIRINGLNPADFQPDTVRQVFAVAQQNAWLFNESISWNLSLGDTGFTPEELREAARKAQLDQFIQSLPQQYETITGELGVRLSGGERQRLAIARALLKKAPVLILDEPAANLDLQVERAMLAEIVKSACFDQIWIVSHRIVNPDFYTDVFILKEGRIVESGAPEILLHDADSRFSSYWQAEKSLVNS